MPAAFHANAILDCMCAVSGGGFGGSVVIVFEELAAMLGSSQGRIGLGRKLLPRARDKSGDYILRDQHH